MAVRDAEQTLTRAAESVLNQGYQDVQLILVAQPSRDTTRSICDRLVERDLRCDVVDTSENDSLAALDAGVDAARGTYVLFMRQDDWLGADALERMMRVATSYDLDLVIPSLSIDAMDRRGVRLSQIERAQSDVYLSVREVRAQASHIIESAGFCEAFGRLYRRQRIESLGLRMSISVDASSYFISYIEDIERVGVVGEAVYHIQRSSRVADAYEPGLYERFERDHAHLLGLAAHWGLEDDPKCIQAIHRRHLRQLIACIENVCACRALSSIERADRVRDMIVAASTRKTVVALRGTRRLHREFGLMYDHIARQNVAACCMAVRMQGMIRLPRLPFAREDAVVAL